MNVFPACMHVHAWCSQRLEEGIKSPGTGVVDSSELPGEFWELNLVYVVFYAEPSLQPSNHTFSL